MGRRLLAWLALSWFAGPWAAQWGTPALAQQARLPSQCSSYPAAIKALAGASKQAQRAKLEALLARCLTRYSSSESSGVLATAGQQPLDVESARTLFSDAVVRITVDNLGSTVRGTGFFVSPDGVLITNYHVVEPFFDPASTLPTITFTAADGRSTSSFDIGRCAPSTMTDICILRLDLEPLKFLALDDELPAVGTTLWQIGQSAAPWVTRRVELLGDFALRNAGYIEVTPVIEHGDSGGPIFLPNGHVVGMSTVLVTYPGQPGSRSVATAARDIVRARSKITRYTRFRAR